MCLHLSRRAQHGTLNLGYAIQKRLAISSSLLLRHVSQHYTLRRYSLTHASCDVAHDAMMSEIKTNVLHSLDK